MNRSHPLQLAVIAVLGLLACAAIPAPALPETAPSAGAAIEWWYATGPGAATAVIRLVAMLGLGYLAIIATLSTVAESLRLTWLRRVTLLVTYPALRQHVATGALTLGIAMTPAAAHAQTLSGELSIASVDRESESFGQAVQVNSEPILLTDVGPVVVETATETNPEVTAPEPHAGSFAQDEVVVAPDAWIVEAGDHLWAIAEQVLDAAGKPTDDATVSAYWARLIAENAAGLQSEPDLIYVGQIITLPPVNQL